MPRRGALFPLSNHIFTVTCVGYVIGDFLRAFYYPDDLSTNAILLSFYFFFLAWLLFFDSLVYYKAYVVQFAGEEGVHKVVIQPGSAEETNARTYDDSTIPSPEGTTLFRRLIHRMDQLAAFHLPYLLSLGGQAYFLNILASFGYIISSFIDLFVSVGTVDQERATDRAQLIFDLLNMAVFIVSALLYFILWYKDLKAAERIQGNDPNAVPPFHQISNKAYMWGKYNLSQLFHVSCSPLLFLHLIPSISFFLPYDGLKGIYVMLLQV